MGLHLLAFLDLPARPRQDKLGAGLGICWGFSMAAGLMISRHSPHVDQPWPLLYLLSKQELCTQPQGKGAIETADSGVDRPPVQCCVDTAFRADTSVGRGPLGPLGRNKDPLFLHSPGAPEWGGPYEAPYEGHHADTVLALL